MLICTYNRHRNLVFNIQLMILNRLFQLSIDGLMRLENVVSHVDLLERYLIFDSDFLIAIQPLVSIVAFAIEIAHIHFRFDDPKLNRYLVYKLVDQFITLTELRIFSRILTFFNSKNNTFSPHSASLVVQKEILLLSVRAKHVVKICIGDPRMIKSLTLLIVAKVYWLTSFHSVIGFNINFFCVPIFFHLQVSYVDILVHFIRLLLGYSLRPPDHIKYSKTIILQTHLWQL